MRGQFDEFGERRFPRILVIGMHADRRIDVVVRFGDREHVRQRLEIDGHAQRVRDVMLAHVLEHRRQAIGETLEIDVAMRVDEHRGS